MSDTHNKLTVQEAYLQNVTVFEKQVVSTVATPIKRSVCQSIATDFLA